jgi:hypothetical protein
MCMLASEYTFVHYTNQLVRVFQLQQDWSYEIIGAIADVVDT